MLTVEHYARIRRGHRDGLSIREMAKTFGHSRKKIRQVLQNSEPRRYTRTKTPRAPKLGPFQPIIDEILKADEAAPRKQRHSAAKIYRRLVAEHAYPGKYDQVRRYVARHQRRERETFIPLGHDPGQRLECDFGQIYVDFPEGRRAVNVLLATWAYSYALFVIALPTQRTEAILHGMVQAFEFFGCVPKEVWWDNPTTVAVQILSGRQRRINERYHALASHYNFEPLFCMPARGNEKPHVENRVKWLEREWATPVPRCRDLAELNALLHERCQQESARTAAGQTETIGERFAKERTAAVLLPARSFEPCLNQAARVNKYQTVRFDNVEYSVPRSSAFQVVTVKAFVDRVEIVAEGHTIARHDRCYETGRQVLDPRHYLATLSRKPACLDHAPVYRTWQLPASFTALREKLEAEHGPRAGARQFIRVLLLLNEHPVERVQAALDQLVAGEAHSVDAIILRTRNLAARDERSHIDTRALPDTVAQLQVPLPDLQRFNLFLSCGESTDVPDPVPLAQDQS
jgi:transposase